MLIDWLAPASWRHHSIVCSGLHEELSLLWRTMQWRLRGAGEQNPWRKGTIEETMATWGGGGRAGYS